MIWLLFAKKTDVLFYKERFPAFHEIFTDTARNIFDVTSKMFPAVFASKIQTSIELYCLNDSYVDAAKSYVNGEWSKKILAGLRHYIVDVYPPLLVAQSHVYFGQDIIRIQSRRCRPGKQNMFSWRKAVLVDKFKKVFQVIRFVKIQAVSLMASYLCDGILTIMEAINRGEN